MDVIFITGAGYSPSFLDLFAFLCLIESIRLFCGTHYGGRLFDLGFSLTLAIIPILASDTLLGENKKFQ